MKILFAILVACGITMYLAYMDVHEIISLPISMICFMLMMADISDNKR